MQQTKGEEKKKEKSTKTERVKEKQKEIYHLKRCGGGEPNVIFKCQGKDSRDRLRQA